MHEPDGPAAHERRVGLGEAQIGRWRAQDQWAAHTTLGERPVRRHGSTAGDSVERFVRGIDRRAETVPRGWCVLGDVCRVEQIGFGAGGAGSALSDALSVNATGVIYNTTITGTGTVAAGGSLVLRRSDRACAGEIVVFLVKT